MDVRKDLNKSKGIEKNNLVGKLGAGLFNHHNSPKNVEEFINYQLKVTGEVWQTNVREQIISPMDKITIVDFILPNLFPIVPSTLIASFFGDQILIYINAELTPRENSFLKSCCKDGINETLKHFMFDTDSNGNPRASVMYNGGNNFKPEELMKTILNFIDEAEAVFKLIKENVI